MVRSAAAILVALALPVPALAQEPVAQTPEPVGTHTVVDDDTLWDLAQFYYQNPFEWRVIWEANRDSIADPNLIYPNQVFIIPGLPGRSPAGEPVVVTDSIVPEPSPADPVVATPVDLVQFGFRPARPSEQIRTIFYRDTTSAAARVEVGPGPNYVSVTRDAVYSAPWVIREGEAPDSTGRLVGFTNPAARASTIRSFDQVFVAMTAPARVGAELQVFRIERAIEGVGDVAMPTGVVTVSAIVEDGVVGVVTKEYHRIQPGDLVRPVPSYTVQPGVLAQEVTGGSEAMIMGFAGRQEINDIGHIAFLDLGSDDGISIGDEFVLFGDPIGSPRGSLRVVSVTRNMASARIDSMVDDVFRQGVVVRLARQMP